MQYVDKAHPRLRILTISHTAVSRAAGQARSMPLCNRADVEQRLLVPRRWKSYGTWQTPEPAGDPRLGLKVGEVMWPWTGPGQWYLHWYRHLGSLLREFRPDVIHLWEEPWGLVSAQTAWLRNRYLPGTRLISETEQNIDKRLPMPFESFRKYTLRNADLLAGRTPEAIAVARRKGYTGPAAVLSYGIDPEVFKPGDREKARQRLGLGGFVIGYAGRLIAEKGLEDLVRALPLLPGEANLVCVGAGPLRGALEGMAEALGVGGRVRFLPSRSPADLAIFMSGIDALALVSRTTARWKEQFGRVIIEAQACGTPVIGSDSGAIPQIVGPGGLVVRERSPHEIAAAIRRLGNDATLRYQLGRAGAAQVAEKYTWQRIADHLLQIYQSVRRRPPAHHAAASRAGAGGREPLGAAPVADSADGAAD